ncbi:hypothetical protein KI387_029076, partial [Taxus chinensis]
DSGLAAGLRQQRRGWRKRSGEREMGRRRGKGQERRRRVGGRVEEAGQCGRGWRGSCVGQRLEGGQEHVSISKDQINNLEPIPTSDQLVEAEVLSDLEDFDDEEPKEIGFGAKVGSLENKIMIETCSRPPVWMHQAEKHNNNEKNNWAWKCGGNGPRGRGTTADVPNRTLAISNHVSGHTCTRYPRKWGFFGFLTLHSKNIHAYKMSSKFKHDHHERIQEVAETSHGNHDHQNFIAISKYYAHNYMSDSGVLQQRSWLIKFRTLE